MKKAKIVNDMPRTPAAAMAPKEPPTPEKTEEDRLRDGDYDMEHLMRAEDIKADPKRMEYVQKAHAKKTTQMRSIADLKMAGAALDQQKSEAVKSKAAQPRHKTRYPETK